LARAAVGGIGLVPIQVGNTRGLAANGESRGIERSFQRRRACGIYVTLDSAKAKQIEGLTVRAKVNSAIGDGAPNVVGDAIEIKRLHSMREDAVKQEKNITSWEGCSHQRGTLQRNVQINTLNLWKVRKRSKISSPSYQSALPPPSKVHSATVAGGTPYPIQQRSRLSAI
jgi:hypothetical protein